MEGSACLLPPGSSEEAQPQPPAGKGHPSAESPAVVTDRDTQAAGTTLSCVAFPVPQARAPSPLFSLVSPHCRGHALHPAVLRAESGTSHPARAVSVACHAACTCIPQGCCLFPCPSLWSRRPPTPSPQRRCTGTAHLSGRSTPTALSCQHRAAHLFRCEGGARCLGGRTGEPFSTPACAPCCPRRPHASPAPWAPDSAPCEQIPARSTGEHDRRRVGK